MKCCRCRPEGSTAASERREGRREAATWESGCHLHRVRLWGRAAGGALGEPELFKSVAEGGFAHLEHSSQAGEVLVAFAPEALDDALGHQQASVCAPLGGDVFRCRSPSGDVKSVGRPLLRFVTGAVSAVIRSHVGLD